MNGEFWREFVRVQSDKGILIMVLVFLHYAHASELLQSTALGGLIVLIQGQRFQLQKPPEKKSDVIPQ